MRIIGGQLKRKILHSAPGQHTHPMGDRVREAIFDMLGEIEDLRVLDLYAGSGALGIESLSRGAKQVTMIEADQAACAAIQRNLDQLGLTQQTELRCSLVESSLKAVGRNWDIVFVDPPYAEFEWSMLEPVADVLNPGGLLVASHPPRASKSMPDFSELECVRQRRYGGAMVSCFRKLERN